MRPSPMQCSPDTINAMVDGHADLIRAEFKRLGDKASYHYADDSTAEWGQADKAKTEALALFDAHPELEAEFRQIARGFLWLLSVDRPPQ